MQIHNYGAGETVFAFNEWNRNLTSDLGIGNAPSVTLTGRSRILRLIIPTECCT